MTNLIEVNGHNEYADNGQFYEIVDTTFFYYYNDTGEGVVGDFDDWDNEEAFDAAVRDFFLHDTLGIKEVVTDHLEGIGYTAPIDTIIIDSHYYKFPAIEVPFDINFKP